ncbi:MAG: hypothetical protein SPI35_01155 [Porphyromonas sp.]|nr:hypothetical protein [Porphyromonas sp.]
MTPELPQDFRPAEESRKHFLTPEGYFEGLSVSVMQNIRNHEQAIEQEQLSSSPPNKRSRWRLYLTPPLYMAASFAMIWLMFKGYERIAPRTEKGVEVQESAQLEANNEGTIAQSPYEDYFYSKIEQDIIEQGAYQMAVYGLE